MMVGIDPEGRGLWYEGVIWSATNDGQDSWQTISVEATAGASGKVSVYVSSQYRLVVALAHMDTWWDNATLEIVQPAATPTPVPTATSAVPPTPRATSTPRPDGAVVHIVESGDTLYGIAFQYDVDIEDLRSMNAGSLGANDMLYIGQEIVISGTPLTTEPTPVPTEEQPTAEPTESTATEGLASFCISAYHDRNGDDARQIDSEELLPNATITLVGTNGTAGTYTTDGVSEPYCFENLPAGDYVLRQTPPAGYQASGAGEWGVILSTGQIYSRDIGYVRETEGGDGTTAPADDSETEEPVTDGSTITDVLNVVIRVSGGIVLLLALVVAGLFIASRRR
jgi:LysM repeat protein